MRCRTCALEEVALYDVTMRRCAVPGRRAGLLLRGPVTSVCCVQSSRVMHVRVRSNRAGGSLRGVDYCTYIARSSRGCDRDLKI